MPTLTRPTAAHAPHTAGATVTDCAATPRRARAKRGEGDRLRAEILDAVDTLLEQAGNRAAGCGEEAVSIRGVAELVGCTPPAIYLHFFDKHDLLLEVCTRRLAESTADLDRTIATITDPVAALEAEARALVAFGLAHPEHYRVLFMGRATGTGFRVEELRNDDLTGLDRLVARSRAATDAHALVIDEPELVARNVWMVAHGIVSLLIAKPDLDWAPVDTLLDEVLHRHIEALRAR